MKQFFIAVLAIVLFAGCNSQPRKTSPGRIDTTKVTKNDEHPLISTTRNMMYNIQNYKSQNDADRDFAAIMKIHLDAGIEMASFEMNNGMSRELMDKALQMKNQMELEVRLIEDMMKGYAPATPGNTDFYRDARSVIDNMQQNQTVAKITGSNDNDFVKFMVTHNLQCGELCNAYVIRGRNEKLKELARSMITKVKKEIIDIQDLLRQSEKIKE